MSNFAHGYALLIGINEHQIPDWALPDVAKDIDALHAVLTQPERCAYPPEQVCVLRGNAATRAAILEGLDWLQAQLAADTSGNATAMVYYSGHGWRNEATQPPTYYLIPYDTQRQSTGPKTATALRAEEFAEAVASLTPQRLLVVLDCCHAAGVDAKDLGAYVPAALPVDLLLADQAAKGPAAKSLDQLQVGHGRAILSSSQGSERSYIRPDGAMSIFTYHLIEALTGHAQPQGGATEVLVSDILSHVHRCVPASARAINKDQHPDFKLTGNFPVALLLGGKGLPPGEAAPNPLQPVTAASPATTHQATNTGSGAIAQGPSAVAAGERGIAIGGNVSGSNLVTGNCNRIDQSSRVFDQRGQTVHGNQTNIAGDVNTVGGLFNAGTRNTGAAPSQATVLAELRKLLTAITQVGQQGILDEETTIDAEAALRKAVAQASKPNPARQTVLEHLTQAQTLITAVSKSVTAATGLATALSAAVTLVRRWVP